MNNQNIPWSSISAYLKKEATDDQKKEVHDWVNASEDNPAILNEIIRTWQLTKSKTEFYKPNSELLWKKLMFRIGHQEKNSIVPKMLRWISVAAIILVIFVTGVWLGSTNKIDEQIAYSTVISPMGSRTQLYLPDSTMVWLNSGASIQYPSSFKNKSRDVFTTGECFFDVTKNKKKQFVVHTSGLNVKVYGTSFNVFESKFNKNIEVSLLEGKVEVLDKNERQIAMLKPGQQCIYNGKSAMIKNRHNIEMVASWTKNILIFEDEPFSNVVQKLEGWYGINIHVDPDMLNNHNYTFKVKTESLKEVLEFISVITPIKYEINGENVKIDYK